MIGHFSRGFASVSNRRSRFNLQGNFWHLIDQCEEPADFSRILWFKQVNTKYRYDTELMTVSTRLELYKRCTGLFWMSSMEVYYVNKLLALIFKTFILFYCRYETRKVSCLFTAWHSVRLGHTAKLSRHPSSVSTIYAQSKFIICLRARHAFLVKCRKSECVIKTGLLKLCARSHLSEWASKYPFLCNARHIRAKQGQTRSNKS